MKYSIDTSALLDGWKRYYPPDVFGALWSRLESLIKRGDLRASIEVRNELRRKDDEVFLWAKRQQDFFVDIDGPVQEHVRRILGAYPKLVDTRKNRSAADPFVIALAMENECAVVTGEVQTNDPKRPNIPDVCAGVGVSWVNLLGLIRQQKWEFKG